MTDRPILFSAPMVRALLDGRKTQTRRVINPQPPSDMGLIGVYAPKLTAVFGYVTPDADHEVPLGGMPGDRLWVKEAHFAYGHWVTTEERTRYGKPKRKFMRDFLTPVRFQMPEGDLQSVSIDNVEGWYKRSSLFMRREDSRIALPVTDVRVQRLQEISEDDAIAEGIYEENVIVGANCAGGVHREETMDLFTYDGADEHFSAASEAFGLGLWNSINEARGFGWDENPWIVAYSFTVQQCNIDELDRAL